MPQTKKNDILEKEAKTKTVSSPTSKTSTKKVSPSKKEKVTEKPKKTKDDTSKKKKQTEISTTNKVVKKMTVSKTASGVKTKQSLSSKKIDNKDKTVDTKKNKALKETNKVKKEKINTNGGKKDTKNKPKNLKKETKSKDKKKLNLPKLSLSNLKDKVKSNISKTKESKSDSKRVTKLNKKKKLKVPKLSFKETKEEKKLKKQVKRQKRELKRKNKSEKKLKENKVYENKKTKSVTKRKQKSNNKQKEPLFSKKTKIALLITFIICILIIIGEVVYLIIRQHDIDKNTIYYDSINALVVDGTDVVAVGSSNFRYSKNYNYTRGHERGKIVKYNQNGDLLFEKMYDRGINTTFSSVISIKDGYIVVGSGVFSEEEQAQEGREAFIIKYDKDGKIIWEKFYQVVTNTSFNKVIATSNGYIAIGQSIYANMEMGNHTTGGGIIVKYDKKGNEVWHNNHGGMKSGNFNDIIEVKGDYYVVGKDASDSGNLVKFNKNGEYQWHKNYNYTDSIGFTGISYLDNSLYVVSAKKILPDGTSNEDNRSTTNTDALFIKYDLNGNIQFEKTFGGSNYDRYNSIVSHDNNLYVVGHTTSSDAGVKVTSNGNLMTGLLVCYDKNGNITRKESLGGSNDDNLTDIIIDSGGSIYISGYSNSEDGNIAVKRDNGKDYFGKIIKMNMRFRKLFIR